MPGTGEYVIKRRGTFKSPQYLLSNSGNQLMWTDDLESACKIKLKKATNLVKHYKAQTEWDLVSYKEELSRISSQKELSGFHSEKTMIDLINEKTTLNQIDHIEKIASFHRRKKPPKSKAAIESPIRFANDLLTAKENIDSDIEFYYDRLCFISKCITDVNHYKEELTQSDIGRIIKIGELDRQLIKERRRIKNQIELLEESKKELFGEKSSLEQKVRERAKYAPRCLNELFEKEEIPTLELILKKYYEKTDEEKGKTENENE